MKNRILFVLFLLVPSLVLPQEQNAKPFLIMNDGQIKSHPVRVFVKDAFVTKTMKPILCLVAIDQVTRKKYYDVWCKGPSFRPIEVAPGQTMTYKVNETPITINGTMMLFDISDIVIPFYATGMRVVPVVTWISNNVTISSRGAKNEYSRVIGEDEIYIGNSSGAILWTSFTLLLFLIVLLILSRMGGKKFFDLIKIYDSESGKLSLSLTQMLLWTLAIGFMVMVFSLMFLQVPNIPDSLIALMGLSVVTGSIGHYQTNEIYKGITKSLKPNNSENQMKKIGEILYDLIAIQKKDGNSFPSIAKAQNLFWTIITLILFIWKSIIDGQLWSVPEELVVLMGISQVSYLIRNQMEIKTNNG